MSTAAIERIKPFHSLHKHGMVLKEFSGNFDIICVFCNTSLKGTQGYHCADCSIFLHKFCAELPAQIQHPLHPEHPLAFDYSTDKLCGVCNRNQACGDNSNGYGESLFGCSDCQKFFHAGCIAVTLTVATSDPENNEHENDRLEVQEIVPHLRHEHPLVPFHLNMPCGIDCRACHQTIFGQVYGCIRCIFVLHKSCALAPKCIANHPLHPDHPLTLVDGPSDLTSEYKCNECDSFLDLNSALFITHHSQDVEKGEKDGREILSFFHPHPLTHLPAQTEFKTKFCCEFCHKDISSNDEFCYCHDTSCCSSGFLVHKSCAELPREIIHPFHMDHPLVYADDIECSLCSSSKCSGFKCQKCLYGVDVECVLQSLCVSEDQLVFDIPEIHECPLRLRMNKASRFVDAFCDVCGEAAQGLVYVCEEFDHKVWIHRSCAEAVRKSEHSIHPPHQLGLLSNPMYEFSECSACLDRCSGSTFFCMHCKLHFHPHCAMLKTSLKHPRHEHSLTYFREIKGKNVQCKVCYDYCSVDFYRCVPCNYSLHYSCSRLPPSVKHEWHIHPMELCDKYINDTFDDQYCDLCETLRNPERGVYVCEECRCATHIDCVIPMVNLEKRRAMNNDELMELNNRIAAKESMIESTRKQLENLEKDLEELQAEKQEILSSHMQEEEILAMTAST